MDIINQLIVFLLRFALLIPAVVVHEFSHAWAADRLGDKTARYSGRLTLNPMAHIDPMWTVFVPLMLFVASGGAFVFGAAKPVPFDPRYLRNPKRDIIWVGIAGPVANFIFAFLCFVILRFTPNTGLSPLLFILAQINVFLGVFNLIPVPPLDGSRVVAGLLPDELTGAYMAVERYGLLILFAMLWFGIIDRLVLPLAMQILRLYSRILL
jgi:Zn-dependent protease